jgi:hypothetical protein
MWNPRQARKKRQPWQVPYFSISPLLFSFSYFSLHYSVTMDLTSLFDDPFGVVATVKGFGADFALSFGFGAVFDAGFGNFDNSVIVQFDNSSLGSSLFGVGEPLPHPVWHQHRPNHHYHIVSITELAWYRYFTHPGRVRELTHEISASDRFSRFCHFFLMPLSKVEELTNLSMERGYVSFLRTRSRQAEF